MNFGKSVLKREFRGGRFALLFRMAGGFGGKGRNPQGRTPSFLCAGKRVV